MERGWRLAGRLLALCTLIALVVLVAAGPLQDRQRRDASTEATSASTEATSAQAESTENLSLEDDDLTVDLDADSAEAPADPEVTEPDVESDAASVEATSAEADDEPSAPASVETEDVDVDVSVDVSAETPAVAEAAEDVAERVVQVDIIEEPKKKKGKKGKGKKKRKGKKNRKMKPVSKEEEIDSLIELMSKEVALVDDILNMADNLTDTKDLPQGDQPNHWSANARIWQGNPAAPAAAPNYAPVNNYARPAAVSNYAPVARAVAAPANYYAPVKPQPAANYVAPARATPVGGSSYNFDTTDLMTRVKDPVTAYQKASLTGGQCPSQGGDLAARAQQLTTLLTQGCCDGSFDYCESRDRCCLTSHPPFEQSLARMAQLLSRYYQIINGACACIKEEGIMGLTKCPPNPVVWTSWTVWSACKGQYGAAVTCGETGQMTRTRVCPPGESPGCPRDCPGDDTETRPCQGPQRNVVQWASWGAWSACDADCGQTKPVVRSRTCPPAYDACTVQDCQGPKTESKPCYGPQESVVQWSSWSQWGACSAQCGPGTMSRSRSCPAAIGRCVRRDCPGQPTETRPCMGQARRTITWESWTAWTAPPACGAGTCTRSRACPRPSYGSACVDVRCDGPPTETKPCNGAPRRTVTWEMWTAWSAPPQCGAGTCTRSRACPRPAFDDGCTDVACNGPPTETKPCNGAPRRTVTWEMWTAWSAPPQCGQGTCTRSRACPKPAYDDGCTDVRCNGPPTETKNCDGPARTTVGWTTWGNWSPCRAPCGKAGSITRTRVCPQPRSMCEVADCPGDNTETRGCQGPPVTTVRWQSWSAWTAPPQCGPGLCNRVRSCENIPYGIDPQCLVNECVGSEKEDKPCSGPPRRTVTWDMWSAWTAPPQCGQGTCTRSRACPRPAFDDGCTDVLCNGPPEETKNCDGPARTSTEWTSWGMWSACPAQCGEDGLITRSRMCPEPRGPCEVKGCFGDNTESRPCQGPPKNTINWLPWSAWTAPPQCGRGQCTRSRQCSGQASWTDRCTVDLCQGPKTDTKDCDGPPETVVSWTSWTPWSGCTARCGSEGVVSRRRSCPAPRGPCERANCPGVNEETKPCYGPAKRALQFRPWTAWSAPPQCGQGTCTRSRECETDTWNQDPDCVIPCSGPRTETKPCNGGASTVIGWEQWTQWSACPAKCGEMGSRKRSRVCPRPRGPCETASCPGVGEENISCAGPPKRTISWSSWGAWSSCPVQCGQGTITRQRTCLADDYDPCVIKDCDGPPSESRPCSGMAPRNAEWDMWSAWSACSVSCGVGSQTRNRRCNDLLLNACGTRNCPGPEQETKQCSGMLAENADWGQWGAWSACPVTCGLGTVTRTRQCDTWSMNKCGVNNCRGSETSQSQMISCGPTDDAAWTMWGSWSACSATCGGGQRTRNRRCAGQCSNSGCAGENDAPGSGRGGVQTESCGNVACSTVRYGPWEQWCPCDCRTGETARRRGCLKVEAGRTTPTLASACLSLGPAREVKKCVDVQGIAPCEPCAITCSDRPDGKYASCASCSQYLECRNGQVARVEQCSYGNYSAFDGQCVAGVSPSCALVPGKDSCMGLLDGKHPSNRGPRYFLDCRNGQGRVSECTQRDVYRRMASTPSVNTKRISGLEFNAQLGACEAYFSPTAVRAISAYTRQGAWGMQSDSPSSIENNEVPLPEEKVPIKVDEVVLEEYFKPAPLEDEVERLVERRMNEDCVTSCQGLEAGLYGSCRACDIFVQCDADGRLSESRCADKGEFDTDMKMCVAESASCYLRKGMMRVRN